VLKKAGIVIAATAVSLLAMSPAAFASDGHRHHDGDHRDGGGLINVSDLGVQVPVQLCGNDIASGVLGILASHQSNDSSDDTDCDQDNSLDND
jgi:hypothetical protein